MANKPTQALRQYWASAPRDQELIETLELRHPAFSQAFYFASRREAVKAKLEDGTEVTFQPFPFAVRLPPSDAQGAQLLDISLGNVGQQLVDELEAAGRQPKERIEVVYRVYLLTDLGEPQNLPVRLSIDAITMTDTVLSAQAGRSDVLNRPFPTTVYTPQLFPGLVR